MEADLSSSVEIEAMLVNEGDYVTKGTPVSRMTAKTADKLIQSYKDSLDKAQELSCLLYTSRVFSLGKEYGAIVLEERDIPIQKLKRRYKYPKLQPQPCHYKSSPAKDDPKKTSQFFLHMYVPFF